jgi:hypothetical protein
MSQCVKKWEIGTEIEIRGPFGELHYSPNKVGFLFIFFVNGQNVYANT